MSRREDIDNGIWSDPDFETLSLEATVLYLWSWTNPLCGMAGIYKVSTRPMTDSKVPAEKIEATLTELSEARFAFHQDGVMFVRTRVKHMRQKTEQIAKSIRTDVAKIAVDHPLRAAWITENASAPWLVRFLGAGWETDCQATLTGASPDPQAVGSPEPDPRPSVEGHVTLPGNGNGNGPGTGPRGRGAGRGNRRTGFEPPSYKPNQQLRAIAAEHFPDLDPVLVENTGIFLRSRGTEPTADAIAKALADVGASRGAA